MASFVTNNLSETTIDEIDSDEQAWIAAHQLFNQLWNKYPVKEGKHKVSDVQIMELYEVDGEAMIQAINRYKEKKRRVPKKYWMNGSTFFNGRWRDYAVDETATEPMPKQQRRGSY